MNDQNPYEAPTIESEQPATSKVRSRFVWLLVPTMTGLFVGSNTLTWVFGAPAAIPFHTGQAAGLGGMIGLLMGIVGHIATRPKIIIDGQLTTPRHPVSEWERGTQPREPDTYASTDQQHNAVY